MANIILQASEGEGLLSASFPANFKNYLHTELYWRQKKSILSEFEEWVFWSRSDGIPEPPPNCIDTRENWAYIYQSLRSSTKLNEKIRAAFMSYTGVGDTVLIQFWEHRKTMEGRSFLTTQHLPFALKSKMDQRQGIEGFCGYRMICKEHIYYVDDDADNDAWGVPGRVFRNQCPEFSPNVEYYSPTEYPLRHHALSCGVKTSYAIPVFEPSTQTCLGVVEKVQFTSSGYLYSNFINRSLEDVSLKCLVDSFDHRHKQANDMNKAHKAALNEISEMLDVACEVHKLRLAQIWVPCRTCWALVDRGCTPLTNLINLTDYKFVDNNDEDARSFSADSELFHLRNGYGIVGRAHSSQSLTYCTDVTQFSTAEYSLSHFAQMYGFSACFSICLQSSFTGNDAFVIEFFFPTSFKDSGDSWTSLREILRTMKENSQSIKLASGAELTEELPIEVFDFRNGKKLHYVQRLPVHELLKNSGMTQMDSSGQQSNDFQNVEKMDFVPILLGHEPFQDRGMSQDSFDQQYAINNRSEIVSVEQTNINVTRSREKITRTPQREGKKSGVKIAITLEEIQRTSKMSLAGAAKKLEVSRSTLKRACRSYGYERWPPRKSQISVDEESIPPLNNDMPSNHAPISIVNGKPQDQTAMQDANVVTMKAKYGNDITIKFQLTLSSTLADLEQHVGKRLKLEAGTYYIKYTDPVDGDLILIACNEDLQEFLSTSRSLGNTSFLVFLVPK